MRMTLDELINAMEPQARKDKALISKCVDGLTEYAAELRQKAGDAGKEQISALRRLVDELAGYWGLDAKTVDHVTAFDRKIQEVDQAVHQWTPTQEHQGSAQRGKPELAAWGIYPTGWHKPVLCGRHGFDLHGPVHQSGPGCV